MSSWEMQGTRQSGRGGLCGSAESWGRRIGRLCLASGLGSIMMVGLLGFPGVELWFGAINVLCIASGLIDCHGH